MIFIKYLLQWGGIAMLASAPFDDWWHGAYGLDVKILSPPHVVLASGVTAIQAGTLILILGAMNRARDRFRELFPRPVCPHASHWSSKWKAV